MISSHLSHDDKIAVLAKKMFLQPSLCKENCAASLLPPSTIFFKRRTRVEADLLLEKLQKLILHLKIILQESYENHIDRN